MNREIRNHFARPGDYVNKEEAIDMGPAMLPENLEADYFQIHSAQSALDAYGREIPALRYPYYYLAIVRDGKARM